MSAIRQDDPYKNSVEQIVEGIKNAFFFPYVEKITIRPFSFSENGYLDADDVCALHILISEDFDFSSDYLLALSEMEEVACDNGLSFALVVGDVTESDVVLYEKNANENPE